MPSHPAKLCDVVNDLLIKKQTAQFTHKRELQNLDDFPAASCLEFTKPSCRIWLNFLRKTVGSNNDAMTAVV